MSSRDFPVRQGVHLFFPTRVTPTPDYPFPSSSTAAQSSRSEASGSVRDRAPAVRRRRVGRVVDGSTFTFDPSRDAAPSRAQRTADDMRSLYVDFYYNDNDHLGIDDMDTGRTSRSRTPQGDEDTEGARERGENGSSAWIPPRYRSPHPLQPPQQRPRSPSILSTSSSVELLGGESLFPFPRTVSVSHDRDRVSSSAFGATLDDGNPITGSGAGGPFDDPEHSRSSRPMRRNPSSRSLSLVEELASFRQQSERLGHPLPSSSILVRRRAAGAGPDDPLASSNSAGAGGPPGNRTSVQSLTMQAAPPLFSDVRRRRSVSDALLTRGDRGVVNDTNAGAATGAEEPPGNEAAPVLTPQIPASLPMTRRRSRGRGSSRAVTPPPMNRRSSSSMGAFAGVVSSLVPIIHVPPHSSPRESVSPIQEHAQGGDSDNIGPPPLDGSTNRNSSAGNINLIQPPDGGITNEANQDVDEMSRLVLDELDCDGEIA